jgi:hypothetical protein
VRTRPAVLIGPARPDNVEALQRILQEGWRVEHSWDRSSFARDLRLAKVRQVVLWDVDSDGVPNAPLIEHCARRKTVQMVVLVHETPVVRLPSCWSTTHLVIAHVMLGADSFVEVSVKVAEQLRGDLRAHQPSLRANSAASRALPSALFRGG